MVEKFYKYLIKDENLNYVTGETGLPKACSTTLTQLRGDCDDYSILFISLCRAVGIPAWLELGILYDKAHKSWGGHGWAKVAIPFETDSGGWSYSAPTIDIVNKQFKFHDPYRFIEWADTGGSDYYPGEDEPRNNLDYYYHTFSYQVTGNPEIVSPDTNNFVTVELSEFGDTIKVPVEGDENGQMGLCMLPGFESSMFIFGFFVATFFIVYSPTKLRKYRY